MQKYIEENTSNFNGLKGLIADYEIEYLRNAAKHSEAGSHIGALVLDIKCIDRALKICEEQIQVPLWNLTKCFADEDFEAIERAVQQIQVYHNAYNILQAYKSGLEKAVEKGQQLQPQTQRVLQESTICQLQAKA